MLTGAAGSSSCRGRNVGRAASTSCWVGYVDLLERVGEHEAVHADHHRDGQLFGDAEGEDVQVGRGLVVGGVELHPAGVAHRHRVALVVPDVDGSTERAVGDGHDERQPEAGRVEDGLGHEEQALARGGGVGARTGRRRADQAREGRELRLDGEVGAAREVTAAHQRG